MAGRLGVGLALLLARSGLGGLAVTCSGTVAGQSFAEDIIVGSGGCTLNSVITTGSVQVGGGGSLVVGGMSQVSGSIVVKGGSGLVSLQEVAVQGDVKLQSAGDLEIGSGAVLGAVTLEMSGGLKATGGTVREINASQSRGVSLVGTLVLDSVAVTDGEGIVTISGGTSFRNGGLLVQGGTGMVSLSRSSFPGGDVNVKGRAGTVSLSDVSASELELVEVAGQIQLLRVETDSDATLSKSSESVDLTDCSFAGGVRILGGGAVSLRGSMFDNEDVEIKSNTGPVVLENNKELNVIVQENAHVTLLGNVIGSADVRKNTVSTSISNNKFVKLTCAGSRPMPELSGNTVTELASGECAAAPRLLATAEDAPLLL